MKKIITSMKPAILLLLLLVACQSSSHKSDQKGDHTKNSETSGSYTINVDTANWKKYTSIKYNFQFKYPSDWKVIEKVEDTPFPLINVYNPRNTAGEDLPLKVHAPANTSFISFFPESFGVDMPSGAKNSFLEADRPAPVSFAVNSGESQVLLLESGQPWGYYLLPKATYPGWKEYGYIFAQVAVDSFRSQCYDKQTGKKKEMEACDPLEGDEFKRFGNICQKDQRTISTILQKVKFQKPVKAGKKLSDIINIQKPLPEEKISSPVTVRGKARGTWYFEGRFSITLKDQKGTVLAEVPAKAEGKWMTEDWVPFHAKLTFRVSKVKKGYLVLQKANPSGKSEHDRSYCVPVQLHFEN